MVLHHPFGHRETEADAVAFACARVVALVKSLTHSGKILFGDPMTGVGHTKMQPALLTTHDSTNFELDVSSRMAELDAVLDHRPQRRFGAFRFARDGLEPTGDENVHCDLSFLGEILQWSDGLAEEVLSGHRTGFQIARAGAENRSLKNALNDFEEFFRFIVNDGHQTLGLFCRRLLFALEDLRRREQGCDRCAEIQREAVDELVLYPVEGLELAVGAVEERVFFCQIIGETA